MIRSKNALKQVVEDWVRAYEKRDVYLIRQLFLDSSAAFHYGTGEDEKIEGLNGMLEQLDRDWSQSEKVHLEPTDFRFESFQDQFAWITCEMRPTITVSGQNHMLPILRSTIVTVMKDGRWRIAHTHASWPYKEQKEGQSFPYKEKSIKILE